RRGAGHRHVAHAKGRERHTHSLRPLSGDRWLCRIALGGPDHCQLPAVRQTVGASLLAIDGTELVHWTGCCVSRIASKLTPTATAVRYGCRSLLAITWPFSHRSFYRLSFYLPCVDRFKALLLRVVLRRWLSDETLDSRADRWHWQWQERSSRAVRPARRALGRRRPCSALGGGARKTRLGADRRAFWRWRVDAGRRAGSRGAAGAGVRECRRAQVAGAIAASADSPANCRAPVACAVAVRHSGIAAVDRGGSISPGRSGAGGRRSRVVATAARHAPRSGIGGTDSRHSESSGQPRGAVAVRGRCAGERSRSGVARGRSRAPA